MLPKGTHEYARFLRPSELAAFCREAGLEPVGSKGLSYNPMTQRYSLGSDTGVNYLLACQRPL
jgi:2-polyprenyl-6-hydroxyphenyl methylase/3-demethylubiquinone-9 3-methyltransferase